MGTRWYRAYEGTVSDPKLGEVALIAECSRSVVIAAWHGILENAASINEGGRFDTNARRIAAALGETVKSIQGVLLGLDEVGLTKDGVVVSWQRRQYESDNSTERSRKHRERHSNGDATLQQQQETPEQRPHRQSTETEKKDIPSEKQVLADFQTFYEAYPKHEGRGQALKAYRMAIKKADPPALLAAAKRFRVKRAGQDQKFTPLPASWLNGERWADEPPTPVRLASPTYDDTHRQGWEDRARKFFVGGSWATNWGPPPTDPACKCPADILAEFKNGKAA